MTLLLVVERVRMSRRSTGVVRSLRVRGGSAPDEDVDDRSQPDDYSEFVEGMGRREFCSLRMTSYALQHARSRA